MQVISSLLVAALAALNLATPADAGFSSTAASLVGHAYQRAARNHASFASNHRREQRRRLSGMPAPREVVPRYGNRTRRDNGQFTLTDKYQGQNFFDNWDFFEGDDPTHGTVTFASQDDAFNSGLAFVRPDGTAVIAVDDTTQLAEGQPRKSVRITSQKTYDGGLFIIDVNAMPHGCGVWPAWWTVGPNWPSGGEIDIIEGVNEQTTNQMTLHTATGCNLDTNPPDPSSGGNSAFTSKVLSTDCDAFANSNAGCAFLDSDTQSYGHGMNTNKGGVFAMLWDDSGVKIWHFRRSDVPADLSSGNPDPTSWPTPQAFWSSSLCNTGQFFSQHQLVIDTTLCGDWAGSVYNLPGQGPDGGSCPGTCASQVADPSNFHFAKWKINYIAVYN